MQDAAEAYVEDMLAASAQLPEEGMLTVDAPLVTVTRDT
jgi:hypothetical protein